VVVDILDLGSLRRVVSEVLRCLRIIGFQSLEEFEQNSFSKSSSLVLLGWVMNGYWRSVELLLYFKVDGDHSSGGKRYI
jgi:hypothetical protein